MSRSKLEARLVEPALCHTFPDKPTCLAYDAKNEHIAVGFDNGKVSVLCKNGQVKVLSHSEPVQQDDSGEVKHNDLCQPVQLMSLCYEETTNKTFLVTTLKDNSNVFLWSFIKESKCVSKDVGDRITVLTWSPTSSNLYIGTEASEVFMLIVSNSPTINLIEPYQGPFVSTREQVKSKDQEVVAVKESPNQELVLVVFSNKECIVKNIESREFHDHITTRYPVDAWWKDNDTFTILSKTGMYVGIGYKPAASNHFVERKEPISVGNTGITKARRIVVPALTRETVIASAGDSHVPHGCDRSQVIKIFYMKRQGISDYLLQPFADPVVDFVLQLNKESNESLLIVLTKSEILLVNPTEGKFEKETGVQYHRHNQLSAGYPYITPPVTCLHYCGECSKKFMAEATSSLPELTEEQSGKTPELVVTGHSDGSVRFWLCYCIDGSLSFQLLKEKIVNTGECFSDIEELDQSYANVLDENQRKKFSAVSFVKVIDNQYTGCTSIYLLVVLKSARVLLYRLWQFESDSTPQSQEIVLMEEQDGPSISLKTPSPHFRPLQQQKGSVQLLQHFSCFYQGKRVDERGGGGTDGLSAAAQASDKSLVPVAVNCVDYNENMGMLAVGTEKCLAVIDTQRNMLIQVIGSENKLLKLCLDLDKHKQKCSVDDCDVVCLETAMINWEDKEEAQLTLWIGTRGGSLGALNIIRESGQVLELKATGLGKHFKESIKGIHFHQKLKQLEKAVPATNFDGDTEGNIEIDFYTTNVVVTMEKHFQIYTIPGLKEKSKELGHGGMMWSGLIQCQGEPFIIYVTKDGHKLAGYNLTDYNHTDFESLPADCHPIEQALSSSNGKHAIMKCSDRFYYIMDSA